HWGQTLYKVDFRLRVGRLPGCGYCSNSIPGSSDIKRNPMLFVVDDRKAEPLPPMEKAIQLRTTETRQLTNQLANRRRIKLCRCSGQQPDGFHFFLSLASHRKPVAQIKRPPNRHR